MITPTVADRILKATEALTAPARRPWPLPASRKVQIRHRLGADLGFASNPKVYKQNDAIIEAKFQDESLVSWCVCVCVSGCSPNQESVRLFCCVSGDHRGISVSCSRLRRCGCYVRAAESRRRRVIPMLAHFPSDAVQQLCAACGCSCCARQEPLTALVSSLTSGCCLGVMHTRLGVLDTTVVGAD